MLMGGCGNDPSSETSDFTPSTPTATAVARVLSSASPTVEPIACAIEDCVDSFAAALVKGDLTALVTSFTPAGLQQATALQSLAGVDDTGGITNASLTAIESAGTAYIATLTITNSSGSSSLQTTWVQHDSLSWRINSLRVVE